MLVQVQVLVRVRVLQRRSRRCAHGVMSMIDAVFRAVTPPHSGALSKLLPRTDRCSCSHVVFKLLALSLPTRAIGSESSQRAPERYLTRVRRLVNLKKGDVVVLQNRSLSARCGWSSDRARYIFAMTSTSHSWQSGAASAAYDLVSGYQERGARRILLLAPSS